MFTLHSVSAQIEGLPVVSDLSLAINPGDVLGVIGPNGSGKSTLLAILAGDRSPSGGTVARQPGVTVGLLRQGFADLPDGTLADLLDGPTGRLVPASLELQEASDALAAATDMDSALAAYGAALARFEALGGYLELDRLTAILATFGLPPDGLAAGFATPLGALSGGQKTRAGLAALLARKPDILLLDEPTNHLDEDAVVALERLITQHDGAAVIVSHDRRFLDRVATAILALDDASTDWTLSPGGYSAYLEEMRLRREKLEAAWHRQQDRIARISDDIRETAGRAHAVESATQNDFRRGRSKKVARTAVVRERKLERLLASEDHVEKPEQRWGVAAELPPPPAGGRDVVTASGLVVRYGDREVLSGVDLHLGAGDRVALLGANGSGKTTLIRCLTGEQRPTEGTVRLGAKIVVGRFTQEQESIRPRETAIDHIRRAAPVDETDARTFLHRFLFTGDMSLRPASQLSYGERARLALAMVVLRGANFLVLDEPLNHLDLTSREAFEAALEQYQGTMLMVLHDRHAIERLATRALLLDGGRLHERPVVLAG